VIAFLEKYFKILTKKEKEKSDGEEKKKSV